MLTYTEKLRRDAISARKYREAHPEKIRERNALNYARHREQIIEINKRWRLKNWPWIKMQMKARAAGAQVLPVPVLRQLYPELQAQVEKLARRRSFWGRD